MKLGIKSMHTLIHLKSFSSIQKWDVSLRSHLPDCRILPLLLYIWFLIWSDRTTVHFIWCLVDSCGLLWTLPASAFGRWTAVIAGFFPLNMSMRRDNFPFCQDRSGLVDIEKLLLMLWSLCVSGCVNGYLLSWALATLSVLSVCETWILLLKVKRHLCCSWFFIFPFWGYVHLHLFCFFKF